MARAKVNLTLDSKIANEARDLGLNMSRLAEAAIADAARIERNIRWREDNSEALDAYSVEVETNGLPLAKYRSF